MTPKILSSVAHYWIFDQDSTSKYGRALRWLAACGHQEVIKRPTSSQMHYGDYSSPAARSQESRIQDIGPACSFFACLLTATAALSLFSFGGRAPHPEGTWPKTLLHKPMGVASTEGGGLARRPSSEIDRLAAQGRSIGSRQQASFALSIFGLYYLRDA